MRFINVSIYFIIFLCFISKSNAQKNNQIWTHKVFDYAITINFGQELVKVDTFDSYEGYVFYFKIKNDSSYFRLNYITPNAKFECCNEESIYEELNKNSFNNISDRKGKNKKTNLYWREIKNRDVEIVYNNCSEEKLEIFNKVMESIFDKLAHYPK